MRYESRKVLTDEEERRFLSTFVDGNHYTRYRSPHRDYVLCRLMLATGIRVGEATDVRWSHVDLERGWITVRGSEGAMDRRLWCDSEITALLDAWKERDNPDGDSKRPVFTTRDGNPLGRKQVWEMVHRRGEKVGLKGNDGLSPSVLRDTFAVRLLRETGEIGLVQVALGHANRSTTERMYRGLNRSAKGKRTSV